MDDSTIEQEARVKKAKVSRRGRQKGMSLSEEEQMLLKNAALLRMMPDNIGEALAAARTKPPWCSDVRWRMELSRRRNKWVI